MAVRHEERALRTDIQGIRALAVTMVVVFHLRESWLPGGYAGVDVFFVISGFLITSHLVGRPPSTAGDFARFWGRRIRRLLPASLFVLACTLAAVRLVAPQTEWEPNAVEARAAAFYVVNWSLAARAVDYLAQDSIPSAVQHYWSLSVEEQFYFFWPLLIGAIAFGARRLRRHDTAALWMGLGAVVTASFLFSVARTASDPAAAYFITPTRIWELGCGGLLALAVARWRPRGWTADRLWLPRAVGSWIGFAMVVATAFLYSAHTPFPGYQAALPVLGTVLIILCATRRDERLSAGPLLGLRPVRWLGDVSYSVYLWHWPIVVLAPFVTGSELSVPGLGVALALTLVLAALTERFVERPFRSPRAARRQVATFVLAGAAMAVIALATAVQLREVHILDRQARTELAAAIRDGGPCFGASALDPASTCAPVAYADLLPPPALAAHDRSAAYQDIGGRQCWSFTPSFPLRTCSFGPRKSDIKIALIGNSHAGQWLPALQVMAREHKWRVNTYLASQCASSDLLQSFATEAHSEACRDWVNRAIDAVVADQPDLVVMSNRVSVKALGYDFQASQPIYTDGFARVLQTLRTGDLPVLVIRDTPAPGVPLPACVAENEDEYDACDGTVSDWLPGDPAIEAVADLRDPDVQLVDLTRHICAGEVCHAVNGGVITYFDASHLTATYAYTLAPYLEPAVLSLLRGNE